MNLKLATSISLPLRVFPDLVTSELTEVVNSTRYYHVFLSLTEVCCRNLWFLSYLRVRYLLCSQQNRLSILFLLDIHLSTRT